MCIIAFMLIFNVEISYSISYYEISILRKNTGNITGNEENNTMELHITCIPGDGIGPEIVRETKKVLDKVAHKYGHKMIYKDILMGGASIDVHGVPLTEEAIADAKAADAVLMGSIGGNTTTSPWYKLPPEKRPEAGLLALRKALNLFANLRPAVLYDELAAAWPLKEEISKAGFDMLIMRELTGGLYFGERRTIEENGVRKAIDTLTYDENEIRRIAIKGFDIARKRRKKVTSVDKANVLDSSRLWRKVVEEVAKDYPDVALEHMLVDNCAMQLVKDPAQFDVILTENMFGDILSDEASMVTGSIGMLASASLNDTKFGLYEPSHGSAPDIAGKDIANPIATVLSAAMMLRYSFDLDEEADAIEAAVKKVLQDGFRTGDIMSEGCTQVGCTEMGDLLAVGLQRIHQRCHVLHGIITALLLPLVACKTNSLKSASFCLIQLHIRYDSKPDCIVKFILVVSGIQVCDQAGQIAGLYHHLKGQVRNQKLRLHPPFLDLILVKKGLHSQYFFHQRLDNFYKIILTFFVKLQIAVIIAYFQLPVDAALHCGV